MMVQATERTVSANLLAGPAVATMATVCLLMGLAAFHRDAAPSTTVYTAPARPPVSSAAAPLQARAPAVGVHVARPPPHRGVSPAAKRGNVQSATETLGRSPLPETRPLALLGTALTAFAVLTATLVTAIRRAASPPSGERHSGGAYMAMAAATGRPRRTKRDTMYDGYKGALEAINVQVRPEALAEYLADGYVLLDVRPNYERERIYPEGSAHIQFIKENEVEGFNLQVPRRRPPTTPDPLLPPTPLWLEPFAGFVSAAASTNSCVPAPLTLSRAEMCVFRGSEACSTRPQQQQK